LAEAIWQPSQPWQQALNKTGIAMRQHERLGRAVRDGTSGQGRHRAVRWRITPDGAVRLAYRALNALRDAADPDEARRHDRDLRVAAARMVHFHYDPGWAAGPSRTAPPPADRPLPAGQWTVQNLAAELGMPAATLYGWIYEGWVTAEYGDRLVVHADPAEIARLRELRAQHRRANQPTA